jgi:hypothetical protein
MEFHALAAVLGSIRSTQITIHAGAIISGAASQAAAPAKWLRQADQPGVQHVTDGSIHHTKPNAPRSSPQWARPVAIFLPMRLARPLHLKGFVSREGSAENSRD